VAILPGRDRNLRREYVVFSAHMDHVGIGRPDARGDSIYNGADDNASGTAAVIAIAAAFASLPEAPRRSIAFVLVSGEERGLWGSRHFVDEGRIPPERMVANLNLDMIGRNWPDTIVAVGKEHSELGPLVRDVAHRHPDLGLVVIPDPWPGQRFFFRSDQHSFARRGVPSLFLFSGTHEDYHRPGDVPERVDAEKTARVARLAFLAGLEVAEGTERPRWNPESHERIVETQR
jgi:Zn-dependent M28 family amino/carboxypeptidase